MSLVEAQLEQRPPESEDVQTEASFIDTCPSVRTTEIFRVKRGEIIALQDAVAIEKPLEIQLVYGAIDDRKVRSISVTMRTPGNDNELVAGFLMTEGVVRDATHITSIGTSSTARNVLRNGTDSGQMALPTGLRSQVIRVELSPEVEVGMSTLERNFTPLQVVVSAEKRRSWLLGLLPVAAKR